ncbi:MAG: cobalt ABC transporter permease [Clostridium argentinense]|uniref:Cobalt ABC transporter permease n=1 Tax=Clostridium faecium TaxID=2762223 RepID=A0ABR8YSX0_9CLOT|nr:MULTISPECIES: CbiQ family ECF transporter T component [Clostridium]MBD8047354.1 cobalt ABC transporter permease [Clostridium faecium]MBS5825470.1 cobalt ABC transporter permease [Clostridium argentinense]MDU1350266.1 CbiQ family ECF transporter T component [Clostridium argentinense]
MLKNIIAYSKISSQIHRHPFEKLCLCIFPIIILGFSNTIIPIILNIIIFIFLHKKANNPMNIVSKFSFGAFIFALMSSITFIFTYDLNYILLILLKSFSGGLCIAYLSLTTPLDHILYIFSRNKNLREICDISKNMERYILLIDDEAKLIYNAIKSRSGFITFKLKIVNTGKMLGLLFFNTMKRWNEIKEGLNSRCYRGNHYYSNFDFNITITNIIYIFIYNIILIILIIGL